MRRTYQELYPDQSFAHLARTVEQYLSKETPLWWVGQADSCSFENTNFSTRSPVACLWLGNAVDQVRGDRHSHIFLLYVLPAYRRKGIGSALMHHAEEWARRRGDRQMGLQVFVANQPALSLYQKLGYTSQSVWMVKPLT
ncbi:MAG: GNAT family N-acetyltransferase [Leptolyngbyaceae cyanobacterium SL_5_9]|nr:GNAT family N-acetyltransferase [Leptolyngbyaceae cyanobacterium SL_5_9]NJO73950.1 GNAT family N-acetyltransferase [Leptolyngbyaceae cyanobacterium RM1_406_9]